MIEPDETKIYLNPDDVELFKKFMEHYQTFKILQDNKAFDIGYGKTILNFAGGILQNIEKDEIVWRR